MTTIVYHDRCYEFRGFDNPTNQNLVYETIILFDYEFPSWVQSVSVIESSQVDNIYDVCHVILSPQYRGVTLTVHPKWYTFDDSERRRLILHEILHARLGRITDFVDEKLVPEFVPEQLQGFVSKIFDEIVDSTIEEMIYLRESGNR